MKIAAFFIGANVPLDPAVMKLVDTLAATPKTERRALLAEHLPLLMHLHEQSQQPGVRQPPPACWLLAKATGYGLITAHPQRPA